MTDRSDGMKLIRRVAEVLRDHDDGRGYECSCGTEPDPYIHVARAVVDVVQLHLLEGLESQPEWQGGLADD